MIKLIRKMIRKRIYAEMLKSDMGVFEKQFASMAKSTETWQVGVEASILVGYAHCMLKHEGISDKGFTALIEKIRNVSEEREKEIFLEKERM